MKIHRAIDTCIYLYIYIYIDIHIIYIYIYVYTNIYIYICICINRDRAKEIWTRYNVQTRVSLSFSLWGKQIYIYIYIYIYIHIFITLKYIIQNSCIGECTCNCILSYCNVCSNSNMQNCYLLGIWVWPPKPMPHMRAR